MKCKPTIFRWIAAVLMAGALLGPLQAQAAPDESVSAPTDGSHSLVMPLIMKAYLGGIGDLTGRVIDASSSAPLSGAQVCSASQCVLTDGAGVYHMSGLVGGGQPVQAALTGFNPVLEFANILPRGIATLNFALSPILASGNILMRFVLTWDPTPAWPNPVPPPPAWENDLDVHLWLSVPNPPEHIFYANPGDCTSLPNACLEADARQGFGPETIALSGLKIARYYYGVHNFNQYRPGVPAIQDTSAQVQVYDQSGVIATFIPPRFGSGNFWYVFSIDSYDGETGVITPQNCLIDLPSGDQTPVCP